MKHTRSTAAAWMVTASVFLWAPAAGGDSQLNTTPTIGTAVGQLYPDFYLPNIDGSCGRLSDFRGKKVLLIHFASW